MAEVTQKPAKEETAKRVKQFRGSQTPREIHGVVYVGHIPQGFSEPQMREYFAQFGEVRQLRLSRSKRTGRSKGYAFAQFESDEIAKIVADSMSGYLMFRKKMICKHVPTEEVHPDVFKGANKVFSRPKAHLLARERHNKVVSAAKQKAITKRLQDKTKQRLSKIAKLGVNYSLPGHCTETSESKQLPSTN